MPRRAAFLIAVDHTGRTVWCTPHAGQLIAGDTEAARREPFMLPEEVPRWLCDLCKPRANLVPIFGAFRWPGTADLLYRAGECRKNAPRPQPSWRARSTTGGRLPSATEPPACQPCRWDPAPSHAPATRVEFIHYAQQLDTASLPAVHVGRSFSLPLDKRASSTI
jgi:hypothetical protein